MLCAMDIEGTIEFILQTQVKAEVRMDKRLDGIAKLLEQGMRMLAKTDKTLAELAQAQKRTDSRLSELAQAQKELVQAQRATERTLKSFIDSMRHGRNGRNGR